MLLIDGVRYQEWVPDKEVEEFQPLVRDHFQDIFGPQTFYFEGSNLTSLSVPGSRPDWFVVTFGKDPHWYIVEAELSRHSVYSHIVDQIGRFLAGVEDSHSTIFQTIYSSIKSDPLRWAEISQAVSPDHPHEFLTSLFNEPPVLKIVIERRTDELDKALKFIGHSPTDVIEFKTFNAAVGSTIKHAHLFEPLHHVVPAYSPPTKASPAEVHTAPVSRVPVRNLDADKLEILITNPYFIKFHLFYIPHGKRSFFPGYKIPFKLEADFDDIETYVTSARKGTRIGEPRSGTYIQRNLSSWYKKHSELKIGDRVVFKVIEPMKKYRLHIVK